MVYDLIIIGGGPAGMSAGIYASRAKLKTLILEALPNLGGQIATTSEIENWPGKMTSGPELATDFRQHCEKLGVEFQTGKCTSIQNEGKIKKILTLDNGKSLESKTVIIATGAEPVLLNVPGEDRLRGKGVAYCATCDGEFFDGLEIAVVGGGNTAMEEAVFLTRFASKVTLFIRGKEGIYSADKTAFEHANNNPKIQFMWDSSIVEIYGDKLLEGLKVKNNSTSEITDFNTDGLFIFVGMKPLSQFVKGLVKMCPKDYIIVDQNMATDIPGIFSAGDINLKNVRQVITAASDGAIAAISASKYLEENDTKAS